MYSQIYHIEILIQYDSFVIMSYYTIFPELFIVTFISLAFVFLIGIYRFALVILLSLISAIIGYILDRSQILNKKY